MAEKGTLALLLEIVRKEIGYVEGPKDNETKYGAYTKANFLPWCGSFVMWCFNQAGIKIPSVVYTPAGVAAFKKSGQYVKAGKGKRPLPGSPVFFNFPGGADIDHVGVILEDNGDGTCWTGEGNTTPDKKKGSQANGGEACLKLRAYGPNKKGLPVFIDGWAELPFPDAGSAPAATLEDKKVALAETVKKQGVAVPPVKTWKPIKKGMKTPKVKEIQTLLGIGADGDFGPGTETAVKNFQKKSKLKVTGIVDEETYRQLKGVK